METGNYVDRLNHFAGFEASAAVINRAPAYHREQLADAAEREGWQALKDYEEALFLEYGQRMKAAQTRLMVEQLGMVRAIEKIVLERAWNKYNSHELHRVGREELSFEGVVARYPGRFSPQALELAQTRLARMQ